MRVLHNFAHMDRRAKSLVIMLPGALQQPEEFVQAGFIDAVRRRGLAIDLALVDLGIEYIGDTINGSALQRIDAELVQPGRLQCYDAIWLGGISIGGLIAIAYANCYPGQLDGLCLLSPYPGNRMLLREIAAAGGLDRWPADAGAGTGEDAERAMWRWLQARREQAGGERVHLGYGRQDRFAPSLQLVADALAGQRIDTIPGDHDWPTWQKLWENFLEQTISDLRPNLRKTAV
ncbi:MAG TPA: alpha/beta hydrolase [Oxalobacteraceae bacterium]|nr:alpha/beta hydrolase [Oxalobacteraceae bacterium]